MTLRRCRSPSGTMCRRHSCLIERTTTSKRLRRWRASKPRTSTSGTPFAKGAEAARLARSRVRDHVLAILGALDVRTFDRDDVERLRDALDEKIATNDKNKKLAWKTVASVWTLVTSMCADMMSAKKREFRVRDDNPCRDVKPPERGARKAKQYLYPSEFLKFVSCEDIPPRWRRAVTLAIYTYTRDAELSCTSARTRATRPRISAAARGQPPSARRSGSRLALTPRAHGPARPAPLPSRPRLPRACPAPGERGPFMSGRREPMDVKGLSLLCIAPRGCCVPWLRGRWRSQGWIAPAAMPGRLRPLTPRRPP